jgi:hypothetical protein
MGVEDQRAAAAIQVSISSFVLTAALAVIAAEGALVTFYLDKRVIDWPGIVALALTPALVVASFIAGGLGLNQLSKNGYSGTWNITAASAQFNWQAIFTLLAACGIIASVLGTHAKPDAKDQGERIMRLNNELYRVKQRLVHIETLRACGTGCRTGRPPKFP